MRRHCCYYSLKTRLHAPAIIKSFNYLYVNTYHTNIYLNMWQCRECIKWLYSINLKLKLPLHAYLSVYIYVLFALRHKLKNDELILIPIYEILAVPNYSHQLDSLMNNTISVHYPFARLHKCKSIRVYAYFTNFPIGYTTHWCRLQLFARHFRLMACLCNS